MFILNYGLLSNEKKTEIQGGRKLTVLFYSPNILLSILSHSYQEIILGSLHSMSETKISLEYF